MPKCIFGNMIPYVGKDFKNDIAKMAADKTTQEW